jgi:hypothetical protein
MLKRVLAAVALVALFVAPVAAGPLVAGHIPADAKWVCHLNVDAVRASDLAKACHEHCSKQEGYEKKLQACTDKLGMNPMQDILGVTVYDTTYERHHGVVLVHVRKVDKNKLLALLKEKHPDHKVSEHAGRKLYTWTAKKRWHGEHEMTACMADNKTIVMSRCPKRVQKALDVIMGKGKSLAEDSPLLERVPKKAMLVARAIDVDVEYKKTTRCPVLKNCSSASATFQEKKGTLSVQYQLVADTEEKAKRFKAIVDGMQAMAALRFADDEAAASLANALKTKAKGTAVSITWKAPTEDILSVMKKKMERWHRMKDHWKKAKDAHKKPEGKSGAAKKGH